MAGKKKDVDESPEVTEKKAEVTAKAGTVKDLTDMTMGVWPGNTPHRVGSYYFDLHKLKLKTGETGLLCAMPEDFVFERVDVHGIEPSESEVQIEMKMEDHGSIGLFHQKQGDLTVKQVVESDVYPGTYVGKKKVFIHAKNNIPHKGRMLISFVGYQIEPWR